MALTNKLNNLGDAVRERTGKTEKMTLDAMATEIKNIPAGGGEIVPAKTAYKPIVYTNYVKDTDVKVWDVNTTQSGEPISIYKVHSFSIAFTSMSSNTDVYFDEFKISSASTGKELIVNAVAISMMASQNGGYRFTLPTKEEPALTAHKVKAFCGLDENNIGITYPSAAESAYDIHYFVDYSPDDARNAEALELMEELINTPDAKVSFYLLNPAQYTRFYLIMEKEV